MQNAMSAAAREALVQMVFAPSQGPAMVNQYLFLNVTRDHIVEDALRELSTLDSSELKKPLKVNKRYF